MYTWAARVDRAEGRHEEGEELWSAGFLSRLWLQWECPAGSQGPLLLPLRRLPGQQREHGEVGELGLALLALRLRLGLRLLLLFLLLCFKLVQQPLNPEQT